MSMIRLLLEMLEQGIDINITIKLSPPKPSQEIILRCPDCNFVTRGHKTRAAAERALRSHKNHCIKNDDFSELIQAIDDMHTKSDD